MSYPRHFVRAALCGAALAIGLSFPATAMRFGVNHFVAVEPWSGIAIDGFDPVAYFTERRAVPGRASHEALWSDAAWRFASAANKAAFEASPDVYAPRFGGFDPMGVLRGVLVKGTAELFAFGADGELYLFRDEASRDAFFAAQDGPQAALAAWRELERQVVP